MCISVIFFALMLPVHSMATNAIAKRIEQADARVCLSRFADYPPDKGRLGFPRCLFQKQFPANEKFWLQGVDFSCVSPWNDSCGTLRAGTLISKRHVVFAKHFPLWKGVRIIFVAQGGDVCPYYVTATKSLDNCDIAIGLLDEEVSPLVRPAKILPANYARYVGEGAGLPIVTFNQSEQTFLSRLQFIATNSLSNGSSPDPTWKKLGGKLITGDSGNPAFLIIGNEPILLYCVFGGGVGYGPSVFHFRKEIQNAMDELCPGYKLESFDFTSLKLPK